MKIVSVLLLILALIAGTVGCPAAHPPDPEPEPPTEYLLTISSSAGGSVTTPGEGAFTHGADTVVSLVAEADADCRFVEWTGDVETVADIGAASTTITLTGNWEVAANFEEITQYELTISGSVGGSVVEPGEGTFVYAEGAVVSLVAQADAGHRFADWTGDVSTIADVGAASTTILMNEHLSISPQFEELEAAELFAAGNGTQGDPYHLTDWYHLNNVRYFLSAHYRLMNDLDLDTDGYAELAGPGANGGMGWEPIGVWGEYQLAFAGSFDGQGHQLRDLHIHRPNEEQVGLFCAVMRGGVIENVGMMNVSVTGGSVVGSLAGGNLGIISGVYAAGSVTGDTAVGGLVAGNGGTVSNSYVTGIVSGNRYVGGLMASNAVRGAVSNSYSTASVSGDGFVGGLVGINYGGGTVVDCYSAGSVSGNSSVGGLVGVNSEGTITSSFWDTETSGQAASDGGTGRSTLDMKGVATFAGWEIVAVAPGETNPAYTWNIVDGVTYPFLSWQP